MNFYLFKKIILNFYLFKKIILNFYLFIHSFTYINKPFVEMQLGEMQHFNNTPTWRNAIWGNATLPLIIIIVIVNYDLISNTIVSMFLIIKK